MLMRLFLFCLNNKHRESLTIYCLFYPKSSTSCSKDFHTDSEQFMSAQVFRVPGWNSWLINIMLQTLKTTSAAARTKQNSPKQKLGKISTNGSTLWKMIHDSGDNESSKSFLEFISHFRKIFFSQKMIMSLSQDLKPHIFISRMQLSARMPKH